MASLVSAFSPAEGAKPLVEVKPFVETKPLVVVAGPTASGKSALALLLAEQMGGEIVSCDSVAIYRGLDIGSAKPSPAERARVPHHCLDLLAPDEPANAGDYARAARLALAGIAARRNLPLVVGGTGLYLRAVLHGLAPLPPRDEAVRDRLRRLAGRRGSAALHRLLRRCDPAAAAAIHPNDIPKLIRRLEVSMLTRTSQTGGWAAGRDPLRGYKVLSLGLNPPRAQLYDRINDRAAAMFARGLLEETANLRQAYGEGARVLTSLGYAQASAVLAGQQTLPEAIQAAQAGHRHYAKRQFTWFRQDPGMHWLPGFGDDPATQVHALDLVLQHLKHMTVTEQSGSESDRA